MAVHGPINIITGFIRTLSGAFKPGSPAVYTAALSLFMLAQLPSSGQDLGVNPTLSILAEEHTLQTTSVTNMTHSYFLPEDTELVLITVHNQDATVTSISYGGVTPTLLASDAGDWPQTYLYAIAAADLPATGQAHDLLVNRSASNTGATSFTALRHVDPAVVADPSLITTASTYIASGTEVSTVITVPENHSLVIDVVTSREGGAGFSPAGDQAVHFNEIYNNPRTAGASYKVQESAGNTTMSWSGGGSSNRIRHLAAAIPMVPQPIVTYYSYQSGDWNDAATWTTDPSGTLSENPAVPGAGDRAVILNGRTVTVTGNNLQTYSLQINEGGTVELGATTGHNLGIVRGRGLLRLNSVTFPSGSFTEFVSPAGGTIEFYNVGGNLPAQYTYNNLLLTNSTATGLNLVLASPTNPTSYTLNGDFEMRNTGTGSLTLTMANAARTVNLEVSGDFTVGEGCEYRIGAFNATHNIDLYGDFTDNGTVNLNRNANYSANTQGAAILTFRGLSDNTAIVNSSTRFWNFRVNKGIDPTYILSVEGSDEDCDPFRGRDPMVHSHQSGEFATISIYAGTVRLGENLSINRLSGNSGYDIGVDEDQEKAKLWIDGATVNEPGFIAVYGELRISSGSLTVNRIVIRFNGSIEVNGGTLTVNQVRPSIYTDATPRGSYVQTGGVVNMSGGINNNNYTRFCWPHATTAFIMTGGEINIEGSTTGGSAIHGGILISSVNYEVTGGTVNVHSTASGGVNFNINSTAPFYNLNIHAVASGNRTITVTSQSHNIPAVPAGAIAAKPLVVLNDLRIITGNNPVLNMVNNDLYAGNDFLIGANTTYTPGTNTTIFDGTGSQIFNNSGTITTGLNNLTLSGSSDLGLAGAATLTVRGDLEISSGTTLRDNGRLVTVAGNLVNSGVHFKPATGAGSIQLTGTAAQTISGNGEGSFNNLTINKTGGSATMTANMSVTGNLRLVSNNRLDIGSNSLTLGPDGYVYSSLTGTDQAFSANRMILCRGLSSDGGVKKTFSGTDEFLYPFGFRAADNNYYYMPAYIRFAQEPSIWGSVTIRPVNARHHLAQGSGNALTTWWRTVSTGFEGIPPGTVRHRYFYDFSGGTYFVEGNESAYIPAFYRTGTSWETIPDVNDVNQAINEITFRNRSGANGDYTAGEPAAFTAIPVLYSSGEETDWNDPLTWSDAGVGEPGGAGTPGPGTIVVIGNETFNHTVSIATGGQSSGALIIAQGSVLDLGETHGHNFSSIPEEQVAGSGTLRISSSNYFPAGDFGEFIGPSGGTVEYYSPSVNITIPAVSDGGLPLNQYRNLVLNSQGNPVTMPETDLTIHDDIVVTGSGSFTRTYIGSNWSTLTVNGDFRVEAREFRIRDASGEAVTILIRGDLVIDDGAIFQVRDGGPDFNHFLELYGNLVNNGTFSLQRGTRYVTTLFRGDTNTTISGNGATYHFYNITVDKGTDRTPVVSLESEITTGVTNPFLTLQNGTFRVDNPSLTVTLTDGNTDFEIPASAALSVNAGEVRVVYGDAGSAGLSLAGRLEVLGGSMFIGNPSNATENSIIYAAAGRPEIIVSGGELTVNGQVRRPTTVTSGALNYVQGGGTVTIHGKSRAPNRALLEIANTGSLLTITGGTLAFDTPSAAGTSFGDIHFRPETSNITGGTLQTGLPGSDPGHNFRLSTAAPLWDVSIGAAGSDQVLVTEVLPPTILNDLIINGNSQYNANGLDLFIEGGLVNNNVSAVAGTGSGGFLAGSSTQTTTFNGPGSQSIAGNGTNLTNFANLTVSPGSSLVLQSGTTLRMNGNLSLTTGTFDDGGNTVEITGNIQNTATHASPLPSGGLRLAGSLNQRLSGIGSVYGNIILDNAGGVTLLDNAVINGMLTFEEGSIYIDDYLLTFGTDASVGGTPGTGSMIILNGALSDQGVRKLFPSGISQFTMPIGVSGKYTPASYNITANTAPGSITVRPVNRRHPAVVEPGELTELAYYWAVDSTGFGEPFTLSHTYHYLEEDVMPDPGSDGGYVAALYRTYDYYWTDLGDIGDPGLVDEGARTININNVNYIAGDFTAGGPENFTPPLDIFYSRNDRPTDDWTDPLAWSTESHDGPEADYAPFGNPVVIASGHTIDIDENGQYSVSVEVNGTLNIGTTVFHNLGTVYGTGKICITSTTDGFYVFPGGYFDEFFETTGTILEFTGDNTATLPLKPGNFYKPYQNVIFSGSGEKRMSADNMRVLGNMTISDGTTLRNTLHNRNIFIQGDWINENSGTGSFLPGTGTVFIEGSNPQQMIVAATERFYNFRMNNPQGLDLAGAAGIEITRRLTLSQGNIFSYAGRPVSLVNTSPTLAVSGGSEASFVDGPLRKRIINGQAFEFLVGNDGRYGPIRLSATTSASSPEWWTTRYVNRDPNGDGYLTGEANLNEPLTTVSDNEYWMVDRPPDGSANIRLRWDEDSYPLVTGDGGLRPLLRVVEYEIAPAEWTQRGNVVSGTAESGTVSTTTPVTQPDYIFTLGVIGVTAAISDLTPVSICDNEEIATIPVDLTGSPPWELTYRTTGGTTSEFTETDIMTAPFNIQLRGSDLGGSAGSPYTLSLVSVEDAANEGVVNEATVEIEVRLTNQPSITGPASAGVNETRTYSTTENAGNSYAWSWVGDNGGAIDDPTGHQTGITFNQGTGTFTLSLVETTMATGCVASDDFTIEVLDVPVPDITPKDANLCEGTIETYSTTYNEGNQYWWTVTGGDCTGCDAWSTSASIEVEWSGVGGGSVTVEERVIASPEISGTASQGYFIYAQPLPVTLSVDPVCPGSTATIVVENSQTDITYQLRLHPDNTPVGLPVPGTGGAINLPTDELPANTMFNVLAYNLGCELESDPITAVIHTAPTLSFTLTGDATICDDEPAEFDIDYTSATANFTITITRLRDGDPNHIYDFDQDDAGASIWSWTDFPLWDGVTVPPNNIYTYSAVITDANGCESESPTAPEPPVEVSVWKRPETGPQYHIPNTHGQ